MWMCGFGVATLIAMQCPSHAFAPPAAQAISRQISSVLPLAARWDVSWNMAVASEIDRIFEAEENDPERSEAAHRYTPGAAFDLDPETEGRVLGFAPRQLADATRHLESAFRSRRAVEITAAMAELSIAAADLADPYLAGDSFEEETPGAHASFSDDLDGVSLEALEFSVSSEISTSAHAGAELGNASVSRRAAIEAAFRAGDMDRLAALRRERLGAALGLARTLALGAWRAAGSPSLAGAESALGVLDAWPSPARGPVTLAFSLPVTGETRIELYDVAGRRVWDRTTASRVAGPQRATIDAHTMNALPAGVYLARVVTGTLVAKGRVVRIAE